MNVPISDPRHAATACLILFGSLTIPPESVAANECAVQFRAGGQTSSKNLDAGQTFTFSPIVSGLAWVRNAKTRAISVQVTNLTPVGTNPKWVPLATLHARDPGTGNYSGSVKLFRVRCHSLTYPDVQGPPTPGGSVPIPYPKIGQ